MSCYKCEKPPERACSHCGRLFCRDHGEIASAVCGTCLNRQLRFWRVVLVLAVVGLGAWGVYRSVFR
jgi:hypothetical protein